MRLEKIIKRQDGSRIQMYVSLDTGSFNDTASWQVNVYECPKGQRRFLSVYSGDDYNYRKLSLTERANFILEAQLKWVTLDEIKAAKMELINKIISTI